MGFPMHGRSHKVERLPVHLPLEQAVQFQNGEERTAANAALTRRTKLEAWIALNAEASSNPNLPDRDLILDMRYPRVPQQFIWDSKHTQWVKRKRQAKHCDVIGRMSYPFWLPPRPPAI